MCVWIVNEFTSLTSVHYILSSIIYLYCKINSFQLYFDFHIMPNFHQMWHAWTIHSFFLSIHIIINFYAVVYSLTDIFSLYHLYFTFSSYHSSLSAFIHSFISSFSHSWTGHRLSISWLILCFSNILFSIY